MLHQGMEQLPGELMIGVDEEKVMGLDVLAMLHNVPPELGKHAPARVVEHCLL